MRTFGLVPSINIIIMVQEVLKVYFSTCIDGIHVFEEAISILGSQGIKSLSVWPMDSFYAFKESLDCMGINDLLCLVHPPFLSHYRPFLHLCFGLLMNIILIV